MVNLDKNNKKDPRFAPSPGKTFKNWGATVGQLEHSRKLMKIQNHPWFTPQLEQTFNNWGAIVAELQRVILKDWGASVAWW